MTTDYDYSQTSTQGLGRVGKKIAIKISNSKSDYTNPDESSAANFDEMCFEDVQLH